MKAQELRIGNYILDDENEVCRVAILESDKKISFECTQYEDYQIEYDYKDDIYLSKVINPIPLNEEWLIKMGFNKEDNTESTQHGCYFSMSIADYKYCFAFAEFRNDWGFYQEYTDPIDLRDIGKKYFVSCGIKHVHTLQNLIFALTGEELKITIP